MTFTIIPAIDLRAGKVVRLKQGDYARETRYDRDPLALAQSYADAGARWLHVVDLDGARNGHATHLPLLGKLAKIGLRVQTGGGVRGEDDVERLLAAGAARVVVGSIAVREPQRVADWLTQYGADTIVPALDARFRDGAWQLSSAGWERAEGKTLGELAPFYAQAGARNLLCTDIDRDGAMAGPNVGLYEYLAAAVPGVTVQASGGVRNSTDIDAVRAAGAGAVVLGRSLLEGSLTLVDALARDTVASC